MSKNPLRIDMMSTARDTQWSAQTVLGSRFIKVIAPAKVNLFLGVGNRRTDGYHDVTTVLHALALHDVMYVDQTTEETSEELSENASEATFEKVSEETPERASEDALPSYCALAGPNNNITVCIDCVDKTGMTDVEAFDEMHQAEEPEEPPATVLNIPAKDNIIFKAIDAVATAINRTHYERITVRLEKGIPHEAGLGGGSSDAAATLLALAHFWNVDLHDPLLENVARSLGSDVAFFLQGGCALYTGAGDVFGHTLTPAKDALVLVKPPIGISTAAAYQAFDNMNNPVSSELIQKVINVRVARDVPLYNNLVAAAENLAPDLIDIQAWLINQVGAGIRSTHDVMLCGSGTTTFAIADDFAAASAIAAQARLHGWWARATTLSSIRAAVLPQD